MKTYVGHREWAREVRVSPDGMLEYMVEILIDCVVFCIKALS